MFEFFISFSVYVIAFFVGSVLASLVAKRMYAAVTRQGALDELDGYLPGDGGER